MRDRSVSLVRQRASKAPQALRCRVVRPGMACGPVDVSKEGEAARHGVIAVRETLDSRTVLKASLAAALVVRRSAPDSPAAALASALGIPVVAVEDMSWLRARAGRRIQVDAVAGELRDVA